MCIAQLNSEKPELTVQKSIKMFVVWSEQSWLYSLTAAERSNPLYLSIRHLEWISLSLKGLTSAVMVSCDGGTDSSSSVSPTPLSQELILEQSWPS